MAIDTANKRGSVSGDMLPFPDGTIDQGDRQQTAGFYRGIAVTLEVITAILLFVLDARITDFSVTAQDKDFEVAR